MNDEKSLQAAIQERVELSAYDKGWPLQFIQESERLSLLLPGEFIAIEQIGSPAVEGMLAKPVIDILGGVNSMAEAERLIGPISSAGYTTSAEFSATLVDRKWFMRFSEGRRTHHLHVTVFESIFWRERVRFRDILRSSSRVAAAYVELKHTLAVKYYDDREAYTKAKTGFIRSVVTAA